jgi:hypothetical protein
MRLQTLYLIGALAVTAIPLSAGAQSLSANDQSTANSQAVDQSVQKCPQGLFWEPAGYLGGGRWRPAHCATRNSTIIPETPGGDRNVVFRY